MAEERGSYPATEHVVAESTGGILNRGHEVDAISGSRSTRLSQAPGSTSLIVCHDTECRISRSVCYLSYALETVLAGMSLHFQSGLLPDSPLA